MIFYTRFMTKYGIIVTELYLSHENGRFSRPLTLNVPADMDKSEAVFENGVLRFSPSFYRPARISSSPALASDANSKKWVIVSHP